MLVMRILSYSPNRELSALRAKLLRLGGCQVKSCFSHDEVLRQLRKNRYGALVLCYEAPDAVYRALSAGFRTYSPKGKIIYIQAPNGPWRPDADTVVDPLQPKTLVATALQILCEELKANMRSDRTLKALRTSRNRFVLCCLASKAVRSLHVPGNRIQDTTNDVLAQIAQQQELLIEQSGVDKQLDPNQNRVRPKKDKAGRLC
jgi:hypothetical protein